MPRLFSIKESLKRSRTLLSVAAIVALTTVAPIMVTSAPLTSVFVNGVRVEAYPVIHEGVAHLPIQMMAQAMEAEIIWDAKLGIVKVNGVSSPASVYNHNGKILLPIEAFITGLGGDVIYDGRNNMIKVETPEYAAKGIGRSGTTVAKSNTAPTSSRPVAGNYGNKPVVSANPTVSMGNTAALANRSNAKIEGTQNKAQGTSTYGNGYASNSYGQGQSSYKSNAGYPANQANNSYSGGNYGNNGGYGNNGVNLRVNNNNYMASQTASTVKPAYIPPYANNSMQTGAGSSTVNTGTTPGFFPSSGATINGTASNVGINPIPSLSQAGRTPYIPRTAQNSVFKVTVSNLETVPVIKDFYKPRTGSKFVVATLSQQNISNQVQIYTGKFSLVDQNQNSYDHLEGLSNFWLVILRPFGVNFGYLVFEVPQNSKPISLVLHALNQAPLTINL